MLLFQLVETIMIPKYLEYLILGISMVDSIVGLHVIFLFSYIFNSHVAHTMDSDATENLVRPWEDAWNLRDGIVT